MNKTSDNLALSSLFNLTPTGVKLYRLNYLIDRVEELEQRVRAWHETLFSVRQERARERRLEVGRHHKFLTDYWLNCTDPQELALVRLWLDEAAAEINRLDKRLMHGADGYARWQERVDAARTVPVGDLVGSKPIYNSTERAGYACPLHREKNGSFVWYKSTNSFYCFGCGKGGDVIELAKQLYGCTFKQAIERLTN